MLAELAAKYPEVNFSNSRKNARLLVEWINKNAPRSVLCPELVDLAVRHLRERFDRLPPPPPPAPIIEEEPAEILESWQLPLDCSIEEQRGATKEQLQDLIQRHGGKIGIL